MSMIDPRRAITEQGIACLICGQRFRHITNTHLRRHALTSDAYKERFGYNRGRPLMVTAVRQTHATNAVRLKLAQRIRRRADRDDPEFRRRGGQRVHRLEELLTRREAEKQQPQPLVRDDRGRFISPVAAEATARQGRACPGVTFPP